MEIKARAKINLTLDVLSKRADGYHEVEMIMQMVDLYDTIQLEKAESGITLSTNLPYLPNDSGNIAYKAAQLFFEKTGIMPGVSIHIQKQIPVAAGLAGGSSNAAAILIALNELYEASLTTQQLKEMGKTLGADVPYCIVGGTALAQGIGERLTILDNAPSMFVLLAKPPISVSTAWAYGQVNVDEITVHPDTNRVIQAIEQGNLKEIANNMYNILEPITAKRHPIIKRIKQIMLDGGALGAMMSGSGPTVFGLYQNAYDAEQAKDKLALLVKDVFVVSQYALN
ncbi:MAG: 4-(cytidine 5'-diphospho)-2-C-methyl-D-erythritol kinase [Hyphomonadaceae bacterium]|nr:4-(cytidine 5'-diphospho)-2-C-methyl-D-erythritol kinase [Clostridia bacterium]